MPDAGDPPGVLTAELTAELTEAISALRAGRHREAEPRLLAVLSAAPNNPDALNFLGVLRHRQGDGAAAVRLIRRAAEMAPHHAGIEINLGNVLLEGGEVEEAVAAYERAVGLDETSSSAWHNLATGLQARGDAVAARQADERAIALDPDNAGAWYGLSLVLADLGLVNEALVANSRAVALQPQHAQAREQVLRALVVLGRYDEAEHLYREWLGQDPLNPVARHGLAAIGREPAPPRASDPYVAAVFDGYASRFDVSLARLGYQAPALVAGALARLHPPEARWDVADLGCGTGLCGPLVRPWARRLVGCDLSAGMLERARDRGGYDALHQTELVAFLDRYPASFDLLVSADTLCYFGPLEPVAAAAARALRPHGHLVFTVEAAPDGVGGAEIQTSGRYVHSLDHVRGALSGGGLTLTAAESVVLRQESGLPVTGWLVTARR